MQFVYIDKRIIIFDLLRPQLRLPGVDLVFLDVHRGELVLLDQVLAQQDRILEVVALSGDEGDEDVLPQRQLAVIHGLTVGDDLPQ